MLFYPCYLPKYHKRHDKLYIFCDDNDDSDNNNFEFGLGYFLFH